MQVYSVYKTFTLGIVERCYDCHKGLWAGCFTQLARLVSHCQKTYSCFIGSFLSRFAAQTASACKYIFWVIKYFKLT